MEHCRRYVDPVSSYSWWSLLAGLSAQWFWLAFAFLRSLCPSSAIVTVIVPASFDPLRLATSHR